MTWDELYDEASRERFVDEPTKRVDAPERTPFERDRARVVHSASLRRLAAKTQVLGPQADDFVRNRLTHSLEEVAQVARDLAHPLGCHPDLAETAALAHDMGHPPFGHNGEAALQGWRHAHGGFEGNAQNLRILTRLEAEDAKKGRSNGLEPHPRGARGRAPSTPAALRRAQGRAPGPRCAPGGREVLLRRRRGRGRTGSAAGAPHALRSLESEVMEWADDISYSVHDFEDGLHADLIRLDHFDHEEERAATWDVVRDWYLPAASDDLLEEALGRIVGDPAGSSYDGSRRGLAALKTSPAT